jgi:hypothetical protein
MELHPDSIILDSNIMKCRIFYLDNYEVVTSEKPLMNGQSLFGKYYVVKKTKRKYPTSEIRIIRDKLIEFLMNNNEYNREISSARGFSDNFPESAHDPGD